MNIRFHDLTLELEDKTYARLVRVAKAKGLEVDECARRLFIDSIHASLTQMRRRTSADLDVLNWGDQPLWTHDCCWHCGVDVLAETRGIDPLGSTALAYRDPFGRECELDARIYGLEECDDSFGNLYWGHVAVADYKGGWVVWIGDDWRGVKSDGSEIHFAE